MDGELLTYRLLRLVHAMDGATNAEIGDVLGDLGLTHALADALWQLEPGSTGPSMREMASRLRCDPSTVTFLADRLEQLAYVTRTQSPGDRRTKVLQLTEEGRRARQSLVDAATTRTPLVRLTAVEQRRLHALLSKAMGLPGGPGSARAAAAAAVP